MVQLMSEKTFPKSKDLVLRWVLMSSKFSVLSPKFRYTFERFVISTLPFKIRGFVPVDRSW